MASITKRGPSWIARVKHKGKQVAKSFRIKAHALAWAQETEAKMHSATVNGEQHSLAEALQRYAEEESVKKRGCRWEQVRLAKFKRSLSFVDKPLDEITPADIAGWRDTQTTSAGTVRRELNLLISVLEIAKREWSWIADNPARAVKKPPVPRARDMIYTDQQIDAVCEKLTGPKGFEVAVLFKLAIETAMRSGEMVSLSWGQVDLTKRVVALDKTKNGDRRDVPLSLAAVELFKSLLPKGLAVKPATPVFTVSSQSRDALFRKARQAAGVEGLTFHDARATALTRLSKKVDVLTLARIAGHRDLKSLQVYYRETAEDIARRL